MTPKLLFVAGLVAAGFSGAALGEDAVFAEDPTSISDFLFANEIPNKTSTDNIGDPLIEFRIGDMTYAIIFYDCTDNTDCASLRFYTGFETNGTVDLDLVNKLNKENRFVTALIDDEDDLVLIMDVLTGDYGLSPDNFGNLIDLFVSLADDAEQQIGW